MLTLLSGADTLRSREKLHAIAEEFARAFDPDQTNVTRVDGTGVSADEIAVLSRHQGFFGPPERLVLVERFFGQKRASQEAMVDIAARIPETTSLVFWDDFTREAGQKHAVYKKLLALPGVQVLQFDPFTTEQAEAWVKTRLTEQGAAFDTAVPRRIVSRVGADAWALSCEIAKLTAYAKGRTVCVEDVDTLVHSLVEEDLFKILDTISDKKFPQASAMIREQVACGLDSVHLLTSIARHLRILTQVRSYLSQSSGATKDAVAKALSIHPFVAQKAMKAAGNFAPRTLMNLLNVCLATEGALKSGRIAPKVALDRLLGLLSLA